MTSYEKPEGIARKITHGGIEPGRTDGGRKRELFESGLRADGERIEGEGTAEKGRVAGC